MQFLLEACLITRVSYSQAESATPQIHVGSRINTLNAKLAECRARHGGRFKACRRFTTRAVVRISASKPEIGARRRLEAAAAALPLGVIRQKIASRARAAKKAWLSVTRSRHGLEAACSKSFMFPALAGGTAS